MKNEASSGPGSWQFLRLTKPYLYKVVLAASLLLLSSLFSLVFPATIGKVLDASLVNLRSPTLHLYAALLLAIFILRALVGFTGMYLLDSIGERVIRDLRKRLFQHFHSLDLTFFHRERVGELSSRLNGDITVIKAALTETGVSIINQLLLLCGSVVVMLTMNWRLSLILLLLAPAVTILSNKFGAVLERLGKDVQESTAQAAAIAHESISGISVVKQFFRQTYEVNRYSDSVNSTLRQAIHVAKLRTIYRGAINVLSSLSTVGIFWFGGWQVALGKMTPGQLVAFIFYSENITLSLSVFSQLYGNIRQAIGSSSRIFELLSIEPLVNQPDPAILPQSLGRSLQLKHVGYAYEGQHQVLQDLNLNVESGEVVALVGASGAGKSTLVQLILRMYDVNEGSVSVDHVDVRHLDMEWLRRSISVVSQDVFLFATSVYDNIRYGRLDATDEEVIEAAKAASAHDFIQSLPEGYDTLLGERGINLSGGQRQRIALARSLIANPGILILDEATSAIDGATERSIRDATLLRNRSKGTTLIVIAHRLETIRMANRAVLLSGGHIMEEGPLDLLMSTKGSALSELIAQKAVLNTETRAQPVDVMT